MGGVGRISTNPSRGLAAEEAISPLLPQPETRYPSVSLTPPASSFLSPTPQGAPSRPCLGMEK